MANVARDCQSEVQRQAVCTQDHGQPAPAVQEVRVAGDNGGRVGGKGAGRVRLGKGGGVEGPGGGAVLAVRRLLFLPITIALSILSAVVTNAGSWVIGVNPAHLAPCI